MVDQSVHGTQQQVELHRWQQVDDGHVVVPRQQRHLHTVVVGAGWEFAPTLQAVGTPALGAPADGAERPGFAGGRRGELRPGQGAPWARMRGARWVLKSKTPQLDDQKMMQEQRRIYSSVNPRPTGGGGG